MRTYSFSDTVGFPLYEQLYKNIKKDILEGKFKPDEKLPSKRNFAKNLNISVITVENAYSQLMAEGYIYSLERKGFFVSDIQNLEIPASKLSFKSIKEAVEVKEDLIIADFASNRAIKEKFPFTVWAKLIRQCLYDYQESLLSDLNSGGSMILREAIAKHLLEFRAMNVCPEQIIIGAGTEYLYGQLVQLLGQDKIYGVENPGYSKIVQVYRANSAKLKYIAFDKHGIDIDELERKDVNIMHTSPSHQFPTGLVMPASKRYELLNWASAGTNRYIIEDDYDSEFRMTGRPIPTLQSIDTGQKVIYMNSFSKSITNALRISYMVLPKHLLKVYNENLSFYTCPVTTMIQLSLARFIEEGYFEKHINRMRNFYRKQRDFLLELIKNSEMSKYAVISEEDAGLHFLLNLKIDCSDRQFKYRMKKRGVRICAISEYYHSFNDDYRHDFIINYSSLTKDRMKTAVKLLNEEVILLKNGGL